jgi:hypothetical protein
LVSKPLLVTGFDAFAKEWLPEIAVLNTSGLRMLV